MRDTLLIVDNDESVLRALELLLKGDYDILTATSGKEALEIMRTRKVECIVSDYEMQDGDGLFLLKELGTKEIPFIVITGRGEKDVFKSFANERAFFIFEKPVSAEIVGVVQKAVAQYHREQGQLKESLVGKNAGNIIHDLRNGLAIIEGAANAGLKKPTSEAPTYLSLTIRATKKISDMVSKYKALMSGGLPIQLSTIYLNPFVRDLVAELRTSFGKECEFKFKTSLSEGTSVIGDVVLLRQVILNLVSNSIHEIQGSAKPFIAIRAFQNDHFTLIEVSDSGSISEEVERRLFSEGFTTKKGIGTGMGLFYCRDLLQKMGANIQLTKRSPTTFSIRFDSRS